MWWGSEVGQPDAPGDPAAGQGFIYKPSGATPVIVLAVAFSLKNAAAAANRVALVSFLDSTGTPVAEYAAAVASTTGATTRYTFAVDAAVGGSGSGGVIVSPLGALPIDWKMSVAVTVGNMNAADQISDARVFVLCLPGPTETYDSDE